VLVAVSGAQVNGAAGPAAEAPDPRSSVVEILKADPRMQMRAGEERLVMQGGLQPSMVCTAAGTLIVQAQTIEAPHPSLRITYPSAIETVVSRDAGRTWAGFPRKPGDNGLNFEGGALALRTGRILALDTYVTPTAEEGMGAGQLYWSDDDWRTLQGPVENSFQLPNVNFHGSSDDYGRAHVAIRLHRRMLELPNGDLLTTVYGWLHGDNAPATYLPTMKRTRALLLRSGDQGRHWRLVSTIAADPKVGTEGFDEPAMARISGGPHAGRLLCFMRTGEDLYGTQSDDEGVTWTRAQPIGFGVIDVHRTQDWAEMFRGVTDKQGKPVSLVAAVVDPDLLELRSGVLVCTFGVRVPARACWPRAGHPSNGNYLAVSLDHGATWGHMLRLTSGVLTTHYTAVVETPRDNEIFVAYDLGDWTSGKGRSIYGRSLWLKVSASEPGR
jgi:hypothetical protein